MNVHVNKSKICTRRKVTVLRACERDGFFVLILIWFNQKYKIRIYIMYVNVCVYRFCFFCSFLCLKINYIIYIFIRSVIFPTLLVVGCFFFYTRVYKNILSYQHTRNHISSVFVKPTPKLPESRY